ncbi:MAG TPA: peptide deformylase [Acidobacteriota bacterium]|nr:peptide deformylase [Acidobacteriota bacterium]
MRDAIRLYGDPVLRAVAQEVSDFDENLQKLADRLLTALAREEAIGVAAPQIGAGLRVFSLNAGTIMRGGTTEVLVNPELADQDGEVVDEEGCLSFPDIFCDIIRPRWVAIRARDLDGNPVEREATGTLARAYVHEIDHLHGHLIIDRVDPNTRDKILARMRNGERQR